MWSRERLRSNGLDDADSGSEPMVSSPPTLEDMDVVVRELLCVMYVRGVELYQTKELTCAVLQIREQSLTFCPIIYHN